LAIYLQLGRSKRSVWGAEAEDVDNAAGGVCPHALVLVVEQLVGSGLLCDLLQRGRIDGLLVQLGQLLRKAVESFEESIERDGLAGAPGQRLVELQLDGASILLLLLLGLSGRAPAGRHGAKWIPMACADG